MRPAINVLKGWLQYDRSQRPYDSPYGVAVSVERAIRYLEEYEANAATKTPVTPRQTGKKRRAPKV